MLKCKMGGIYRIRNKQNGKRYIGSTKDFQKAWIRRRQALLRGDYHNPYLQRAWNKYGEENFEFEFIEVVVDRDDLLSTEQMYLDEGFEKGLLYNIARKAGGGNHGSEANLKISQALLGRPSPLKGRIFPQGNPKLREHYEKHGSHLEGTSLSEEHLQKVRQGLAKHYETHDGHFKGKHHSQETKDEYRRVRKGAVKIGAPFKALFNEITHQLIPAGMNFFNVCRVLKLNYDMLYEVKSGNVKRSRSGWRFATHEEIEMCLSMP